MSDSTTDDGARRAFAESGPLDIAIELGDRLLDAAVPHAEGLAWTTAREGYAGEAEEGAFCELGDGAAGIALYLAALYESTSADRFIDAALGSARWLLEASPQLQHRRFGVWDGRAGVALALMRVARATDDIRLRDGAVELLAGPAPLAFLRSLHVGDGVASGRSGVLLVAAALYADSGDDRLVPLIESAARSLCSRAFPHPTGTYWCDTRTDVEPLIGLAHGVAGVGAALHLSGTALQDDGLTQLGRWAGRYVSARLQARPHGHVDFRRSILNGRQYEEHLARLRAGDDAYFCLPRRSTSLAHGLPGIRAALRTIGEDVAEQPVQPTRPGAGCPIGLWEGLAGEVLAAHVSAPEPDRTAPPGAADLLGASYDEGIGPTLGNGIAGVGWTLLSLAGRGVGVPALPTPSAYPLPRPVLDRGHAVRAVWSTRYARTIQVASGGVDVGADPAVQPDADGDAGSLQMFEHFVARATERATGPVRERLVDIHALESAAVEVAENVRCGALLHARELAHNVDVERLLNLAPRALLDAELVVNADARLVRTRWDWCTRQLQSGGEASWRPDAVEARRPAEDNLHRPAGSHAVLLTPSTSRTGVAESLLSDVTAALLGAFGPGRRVREGVEGVLNLFDLPTVADRATASDLVLRQIRELVGAQILTAP